MKLNNNRYPCDNYTITASIFFTLWQNPKFVGSKYFGHFSVWYHVGTSYFLSHPGWKPPYETLFYMHLSSCSLIVVRGSTAIIGTVVFWCLVTGKYQQELCSCCVSMQIFPLTSFSRVTHIHHWIQHVFLSTEENSGKFGNGFIVTFCFCFLRCSLFFFQCTCFSSNTLDLVQN